MTDKPKCPFCESELRTSMLDEPVAWYCPNRCIGTYEPKVWRALITGKEAQDENKKLRVALQEIVDNPHGAACHNYQRAKNALEEKQ